MNKIVVGRTTRLEMHKLLGKPMAPGASMEVWEYDPIEGKVPSIEVNYKVRRKIPRKAHKVVGKESSNLPDDPVPEKDAKK